MKKTLITAIALTFSGLTQAGIPLLNYTCPGNIGVHADQGGPVFINGKEAKLKIINDKSYDATGSDVTVSIGINPDESLAVMYTGKHGANGICSPSQTK
jgi:hypothetical protein